MNKNDVLDIQAYSNSCVSNFKKDDIKSIYNDSNEELC